MAEPLDLKLDVAEAKAEVQAKPAPAEKTTDPELEAKAERFAETLLSLDLKDLKAQRDRTLAVENAGRDVQRRAAQRSQMLQEPIKTLSKHGEDGGVVGKALIDLKLQIEELDPARFDFSPGWFSRLAGALPFVGTPLKRYFTQYESAQTVIDAIVRSLQGGREQLKRDNVTLGEDQRSMRELTLELDKQIQLLMLIDKKLQAKLDGEIPQDDPKYRFVAEELVFPLRQRIQDLQQQLAVNQQGVLAVEIVIRNNKELVRGVNRALEVTINALQVAVTVALALAHQKIVLDKVNALNTTTSDLIAGTAARLREQGTAIHQQASQSMLNIDSLKAAFTDIHAALDEIARFRQEALPRMAETILELDGLAKQGEKEITKMEQGDRVEPALRLDAGS